MIEQMRLQASAGLGLIWRAACGLRFALARVSRASRGGQRPRRSGNLGSLSSLTPTGSASPQPPGSDAASPPQVTVTCCGS